MLRYYIFAHAVKLRYNLDYPFVADDYEKIEFIPIGNWVPLVDQYTKLPQSAHLNEIVSRDLLRQYFLKNISIPIFPKQNSLKIDDISILYHKDVPYKSKMRFLQALSIGGNDFLKAIMFDNVVYERAATFHLGYKDELVSREMLFISSNKGFRISSVAKDKGKIPYYCSCAIMPYLFEEFKLLECYRIMPKKNDVFMSGCVEGAEIPYTDCIVEDLGPYIKYRWLSEHINPEKVKIAYKIEKDKKDGE